MQPRMKRSRIAFDLQVIIALGLWLCGGVLSVAAEESPDLASHPEFWPKQVTIRPSLIVNKDKNTIKLPAGSEVEVVALEKNNLVIERQGMTGRLPVEDTNFLVLYQANALAEERKKLIQSAPTITKMDIPESDKTAKTANQLIEIEKLELPSAASFLETQNYVNQLYKLVQELPPKKFDAAKELIAKKLQAVDPKHLEALLMASNFNKAMPYDIIDQKITPENSHLLLEYLRPEFYLYNQQSSFFTLLDILLSHGLHIGHETAIKTAFEQHLFKLSSGSERLSNFVDNGYLAAMERLQIYPDEGLMKLILTNSQACDAAFSLMFSENSPYSQADLEALLINTDDDKRRRLNLLNGTAYPDAKREYMASELRSNLVSAGNIISLQSIFEDPYENDDQSPKHRLFYKLEEKNNILYVGLLSRSAHEKVNKEKKSSPWVSKFQSLNQERLTVKYWLKYKAANLI